MKIHDVKKKCDVMVFRIEFFRFIFWQNGYSKVTLPRQYFNQCNILFLLIWFLTMKKVLTWKRPSNSTGARTKFVHRIFPYRKEFMMTGMQESSLHLQIMTSWLMIADRVNVRKGVRKESQNHQNVGRFISVVIVWLFCLHILRFLSSRVYRHDGPHSGALSIKGYQ